MLLFLRGIHSLIAVFLQWLSISCVIVFTSHTTFNCCLFTMAVYIMCYCFLRGIHSLIAVFLQWLSISCVIVFTSHTTFNCCLFTMAVYIMCYCFYKSYNVYLLSFHNGCLYHVLLFLQVIQSLIAVFLQWLFISCVIVFTSHIKCNCCLSTMAVYIMCYCFYEAYNV